MIELPSGSRLKQDYVDAVLGYCVANKIDDMNDYPTHSHMKISRFLSRTRRINKFMPRSSVQLRKQKDTQIGMYMLKKG